MTTYTADDIKTILARHRKWYSGEGGMCVDLMNADLEGADLRSANLRYVNLRYANLVNANLQGAHLRYANLRYANLEGADLRYADLTYANLADANLTAANLTGADLRYATLDGATLDGATLADVRLPDGMRWDEYLRDVVPALLTAGGKSLNDVATEEVWACHTWPNCPMHAAFGAKSPADVPALYRVQAERFIQLFDAKLIPRPTSGK